MTRGLCQIRHLDKQRIQTVTALSVEKESDPSVYIRSTWRKNISPPKPVHICIFSPVRLTNILRKNSLRTNLLRTEALLYIQIVQETLRSVSALLIDSRKLWMKTRRIRNCKKIGHQDR